MGKMYNIIFYNGKKKWKKNKDFYFFNLNLRKKNIRQVSVAITY